ncbi:hypothetical protein Slin14017_G084060 [Septoria linicola]|nr:hypothetical protein Slin14017_G084060 [Septoria linicola]
MWIGLPYTTIKNVSATICEEPMRSRQYTIKYGIAGFTLVVIAYILRILPKTVGFAFNKHVVSQLWWDDIAISISMLIAIPAIVLAILITEAGLGKDVWAVPFPNITRMLKLNYFGSITYVVGLGFVKISLLLTYLRFFPAPAFTRWTYAVIAINLAFIFAVLVVLVFSCNPPSYYWHRWDLEHRGHCMDINAGAWSVAAINIFLDAVVLLMPMPQLWRLQLNKRKKCLLTLMLGIGAFASIVSILRLHSILKYADSRNLTWDNVPTSYWSRMEFHAAFVCACLPAIYTYIRRFFNRVTTNSREGSNQRRSKTEKPMSDWMASIDRHVREKAWKFNSMPRTRLPTVGESEEALPEIPDRAAGVRDERLDSETTFVEHIEMVRKGKYDDKESA